MSWGAPSPSPSRTLDRSGWPEWAIEAFEERAALLEHVHGYETARAERAAWGEIRLQLERLRLEHDWRRRSRE